MENVEDLASDMANVLARAGRMLVDQRQRIVELLDQIEGERKLTQSCTDGLVACRRELDYTQRTLQQRTDERDTLSDMLSDAVEEKEMAEAELVEMRKM